MLPFTARPSPAHSLQRLFVGLGSDGELCCRSLPPTGWTNRIVYFLKLRKVLLTEVNVCEPAALPALAKAPLPPSPLARAAHSPPRPAALFACDTLGADIALHARPCPESFNTPLPRVDAMRAHLVTERSSCTSFLTRWCVATSTVASVARDRSSSYNVLLQTSRYQSSRRPRAAALGPSQSPRMSLTRWASSFLLPVSPSARCC